MTDSIRDAAEHAYGLLWLDRSASFLSVAARKLLIAAIGNDGQKRGIEAAKSVEPSEHTAPVAVSGIHLHRLGDHVFVAVEIDGEWIEVIRERHDGAFSHIVEPSCIRDAFMKKLRLKLFA